ncbi:MAG: hypothetical protein ACRDTF_09180, partial [Pseudonocardiaceae bacterium]
ALRIGAVTIGEAELSALKKLAAGNLEFDLYNTTHKEYIYAASDGFAYDGDRRRVFTWRPKPSGVGERVTQGRWRIHYPT